MADERAERASKIIASEFTQLAGPSGCVNWPRIMEIITAAYAEQMAELERLRATVVATAGAAMKAGAMMANGCKKTAAERDELKAKLAAAEAQAGQFNTELASMRAALLEIVDEGFSDDPRDYARIATEMKAIASKALNSYSRGQSLLAELEALRERLARIDAGVKADADDLAKMRDGTKLTRAGVVEIIMEQKEQIEALRGKVGRYAKAFGQIQAWACNRGFSECHRLDRIANAATAVLREEGGQSDG